jgi:hypothetical protein
VLINKVLQLLFLALKFFVLHLQFGLLVLVELLLEFVLLLEALMLFCYYVLALTLVVLEALL